MNIQNEKSFHEVEWINEKGKKIESRAYLMSTFDQENIEVK